VAHEAYDSQRALVTLGRDLRARLALGAPQAEVAKRAGMTQAELSRLENGLLAKAVTYTTLTQLSRALNHAVVLQPTAGKKTAVIRTGNCTRTSGCAGAPGDVSALEVASSTCSLAGALLLTWRPSDQRLLWAGLTATLLAGALDMFYKLSAP
jgi:transcriptional regulator with XRE-family HTH domain